MINLTQTRIDRMIARCKTPAAASRMCQRLYQLAQARAAAALDAGLLPNERERSALLNLSAAMNEHRHVILASWHQIDKVAEHEKYRDELIAWALRSARTAAS